jgi:hypothetical protein
MMKHVASLLEQLAKHHLAALGGEFLFWEHQNTTHNLESYDARPTVLISIDEHSVQTRRASVDRGREPPKLASNPTTIIKVNGVQLDHPTAIQLQLADGRVVAASVDELEYVPPDDDG